jgi:hypothetical protein
MTMALTRRQKATIVASTFLTISLGGNAYQYGRLAETKSRLEGPAYIHQAKDSLASELEKRLNIQFAARPKAGISKMELDGEYSSRENTIRIHPSFPSPTTSMASRTVRLKRKITGERYLTTASVYAREMGNAYMDQRRNALHAQNTTTPLEQQLGSRLLTEQEIQIIHTSRTANFALNQGIGQYFSKALFPNDKITLPGLKQWPVSADIPVEDQTQFVYGNGYAMVKPLIKKHGVQRVVDYFILHPVQVEKLPQMNEYLARVDKELSRAKK